MATLGGIPIADRASEFESGSAFLLVRPSRIDRVVNLPSGAQVELRSGKPYIVSRLKSASNPPEVFAIGYDSAQIALDLLSVAGITDQSTRDSENSHILWWRENAVQVLRIVDTSVVESKLSISVRFIDDKGNIETPPEPALPTYHESLRFFRISQTSDDIFDAYRNMWLAFESVLSYKYPKNSGESEKDWLRRALGLANATISLAQAFNPSDPDIVADIIKHLYNDTRLKLFHSKEGKPHIVPNTWKDIQAVSEALKKLTNLFVLLAKHWLALQRGGGILTELGFKAQVSPILTDAQILVSADSSPLDPDETLDSPTFADVITLNTNTTPQWIDTGLAGAFGSIELSDRSVPYRVSRLGLSSNNQLMLLGLIEAELICSSIDRLEAQMRLRIHNANLPRYLFTH